MVRASTDASAHAERHSLKTSGSPRWTMFELFARQQRRGYSDTNSPIINVLP
jgi:hypothetical protein